MKRLYTETDIDNETWTYYVDIENLEKEIDNLKEKEIGIITILAYIYDLYEDYLIPESIECHLYEYTDPEDIYSDIHGEWIRIEGENPLKKYF